jgi:hypothetical protein
MRMAARTAVVAGTATAVSSRVAYRQADKHAAKEQQAYNEQQAAAPAAPAEAPAAAAPAQDDQMTQLQNLAALHTQGVLSDEEFAAAKAKVLGI